MDKDRRFQAELYRSKDILMTEWAQVKKNLDILRECVLLVPEEEKERIYVEIQRAEKIEKNAAELEKIIEELAESGGSDEAIQNAERLYKRLDEGK